MDGGALIFLKTAWQNYNLILRGYFKNKNISIIKAINYYCVSPNVVCSCKLMVKNWHKAFAEELDKLLPGQFEVEVLKMGQYIQKYGDIPELSIKPAETSLETWGEMPQDIKKQFIPSEWKVVRKKWSAFWQGLRDQKFHMSQTQITVIGLSLIHI